MEDLESWEGSGVGSLRLDLGLGFACGIALCMYMFYLVTDYRLLPAMQATCKKLHIPDDVAGATLLGASLNAPELFTSAVSTFATHNDVGVGVVVGSFNFNIFMITGVTALVARRKLRSRQLKVEWLFLQRDVYFYALSVGLLVIFCRDEVLEWWECSTMVVVYLLYVLVCVFSGRLTKLCCPRLLYKPRRRRDVLVHVDELGDFDITLWPKDLERSKTFSRSDLSSEDVVERLKKETEENYRLAFPSALESLRVQDAAPHELILSRSQQLISSHDSQHEQDLFTDISLVDENQPADASADQAGDGSVGSLDLDLDLGGEKEEMEKEKEFRKKVKRSLRGGSRSNRNHQVPIWSPSSFRNTRETTPLLEASPYSRMTRAFSNPISVGEISFDSIALKAKGGKKKRITREEEKQLIHIATHPEAPDKINVDLRLVQCAHDEMSRRDPWALDVLAIAEDIELEEEAEAYHSQHLLAWPKYGSAGQKIAYVLNFPLHVLITFTIPSGEKFYVLSIVLSVFWLAGISYTLSLCSKNFGNALRINDAVIGLTIDSIGTSLPNLLAAVMAGKRGRSETAICQAFGSNTFDALVAFGLVQFIKSVSVNFEPIQLNAKGIEQNSVINLVLLFLYTWFLYFFRFRLTKAFGATCIFLYSAWLSYQLYLVYSNEEA